jgi:hypothetical protein
MGANYDMVVVSSTARPAVIKAVRAYLAQHGLRVIRQATTRRSTAELDLTGDDVVFVGPGSSWISIAWQAPHSLVGDWFSRNGFAIHLSDRLGIAILLWSLNSGCVCGYSVYEKGSLTESDVRFWNARHDDELYEGVPTPPTLKNGRLASLLNDAAFDYHRFLSEADSLETATGVLASRFGLKTHLVDASSAVEGEPAVAIVNGEYETVDMARWTAILYEPA